MARDEEGERTASGAAASGAGASGAGASGAGTGRRTIVHVITRLLKGGAEENTVSTCLAQARSGARVVLVHGPGADPVWAARLGGRVALVELADLVHPVAPGHDLRAIRTLARLLERLGADVVHTHESKAGIVGRLAAAAAGVPTIVHGIHIAPFLAVGPLRAALYRAAERLAARPTDLFVAVSEGMAAAYRDAGIGPKVPMRVIHSGMPIARFRAARAPGNWRARIGGWEGARPTILLMTAAFEARKRHAGLLDALAPALRARGDLVLLFAGDGIERPACEAQAHALGIADKVRFLGHDPEPWALVALADICLHAAEREGLPRTAVQAIAGGRPLVVADLPGIGEIVVDGHNGRITPPDDLGALAAAALALVDDPARRARLAEGARQTDVASWSEETMAAQMAQAYALVERGRTGPPRRIEFVGLPGAGKSTVARQLAAAFAREGRPVSSSRDAMGDDLGLARRSARRLAAVARALARRPGVLLAPLRGLTPVRRGGIDALRTRWNFLSVAALSPTAGPGPTIWDQGVAQAIWSARVHHGADAAPIARIDRALPGWIGETLFVEVVTPADLARDRLGRRRARTSRFQRPAGRDCDRWQRGEAALQAIAGDLRRRLAARGEARRWLRVDGRLAPDEAARQVLERFRLLGG